MLVLKNIIKNYNTFGNNLVHALKKININFSDTGCNFILGKSDSGKSTLLNLIGGLDHYDDGETF